MTVLATVISTSHRIESPSMRDITFATDRPFGPEAVDLEGVRWEWGGTWHFAFGDPSHTIRLGTED
jgi:hypothetical protein